MNNSIISVKKGNLYSETCRNKERADEDAELKQHPGLHSLDSEEEKRLHQEEVRRQLFTVNLRAGRGMHLSRPLQCGEGGRLQNKQQEWKLREEERMTRDREGQLAARVIRHARVRKGLRG